MGYSKSKSEQVSALYSTWYHSRYGQDSSNTYSNTAENTVDAYYDENPNWKDDIRSGRQAATYMNVDVVAYKKGFLEVSGWIHENPDWGYEDSGKGQIGHFLATGTGFPYPPFPSTEAANNRALSGFIRKAKAAQQAVAGGVFLGELAETVRLIRSPLHAFRKGLDSYHKALRKRVKGIRVKGRRGKHRDPRNRIVRDTWLEYVFGWRPLVQDLDGIVKHAAYLSAGVEQPPTKMVSHTGHDETSDVNDYAGYSNGAYYQTRRKNEVSRKTTVKYLGRVSASDFSKITPISLGIGLRDFVPTVWELIPYSFLVDYFINIGDIVEAQSWSQSNLIWAVKWTIVESKYKLTYHSVGSWNDSTYDNSIKCTPAQRIEKNIVRAPLLAIPIPSIRLRMPGSGSWRWLNIAALARIKF